MLVKHLQPQKHEKQLDWEKKVSLTDRIQGPERVYLQVSQMFFWRSSVSSCRPNPDRQDPSSDTVESKPEGFYLSNGTDH